MFHDSISCWGSTLRQSTYIRRRKGEPSASGLRYICRLARRVTFISFKLPSVSLGDVLLLGDFEFCRCIDDDEFLNRNVLTLDVSSAFSAAWREVVMSLNADAAGAVVGGRVVGVGGGCLEKAAWVAASGVFIERRWCKTRSWPSNKTVNRYISNKSSRGIYQYNYQLVYAATRTCRSLRSEIYSLHDGMQKVDALRAVLACRHRIHGCLEMSC